MPQNQSGRTIPPLLRKVIFRALVGSAIICIGMTIVFFPTPIRLQAFMIPFTVILVPPLMILVHHIMSIWPRKYWLIICELVLLVIETGAAMVRCWYFGFSFGLDEQGVTAVNLYIRFFAAVSGYTLVLCVVASFFLSLYDVLFTKGKGILQVHDPISAWYPLNSTPKNSRGRVLSLVFGKYLFRRRFSTDSRILRLVRGVLAGLLLVLMVLVTFYALIVGPISHQSGFTPIKTSHSVSTSYDNINLPQPSFIVVAKLGHPPGNWTTHETRRELMERLRSSLNATLFWSELYNDTNINSRCDLLEVEDQGSFSILTTTCTPAPEWVQFSNPFASMWLVAHVPQVLITVDWNILARENVSSLPLSADTLSQEALIYFGLTNSTEDVVANTLPTLLLPGSHVCGIPSFSLRERITNSGITALGIPATRRFLIANIYSLMPDPSPLITKSNSTATLRILPLHPSAPEFRLDGDVNESTVLSGFALAGGVWTFLNGLFAIVFGTTLLLVLFGIKPLSIYGLIHFFRRRKGVLHAQYPDISSEEQGRTVAILREHLLDIQNDVETGRSAGELCSELGRSPTTPASLRHAVDSEPTDSESLMACPRERESGRINEVEMRIMDR